MPLQKPKKAVKQTIAGALFPDFSHRARMSTVQTEFVIVMTVKRPHWSAMYPGKIRPKMDAAFKMAMSWYDNPLPT